MKRRDQYLAGALEKVSVALLVATFVTADSGLERILYLAMAMAAFALGYYITRDDEE